MHYLGTVLVIIAWSIICCYAGMKWGNKEMDRLNDEVKDLRRRLALKIAGSNPYR